MPLKTINISHSDLHGWMDRPIAKKSCMGARMNSLSIRLAPRSPFRLSNVIKAIFYFLLAIFLLTYKTTWNGIGKKKGNFFLLLSPVSLTELCSFWYGLKDLFTLHKLADKVVLDR